MHPSVKISVESKRGCGYRKIGGKYLVGRGPPIRCGRLPIPLKVCPCCGTGFKPARGWTWVDAERLILACLKDVPCYAPLAECAHCVINQIVSRGLLATDNSQDLKAGLIWIGKRFYPTIGHFIIEAEEMGISRRLNSIPRDFKIGETFVLLAHRKVIAEYPQQDDGSTREPEFSPGIFRIWKPDAIEVVVDENVTDKQVDGYLKRGWKPVLVKHD